MKKMSKGKKIAVSVAGALVLAAVGVYFGVSYYYSSHFFPRTVINGLNCAGLSVDQVKEKIQSQILSYTLTLTERGGQTEQLTGDQLELKYVDDKKVEALMEEQNPFAWPIYVVRQNEHEMAANISYSAETLTQLVDALACFQEENVTAPEDAKITDNGTAQITPQDICVLQQLAEQVIRSLLVGMVTDGRGDQLDLRCGKTGIFQIGNCQFGTLFAMDAMTAVFGVQCDVVQPGSGRAQRTVQVSVHGQHRRGICS